MPAWPTIVDYTTGVTNATIWNKALGDSIKAYIDGTVSGSASTLTPGRTLTIGGTGKLFDGSVNVSWSLTEIGVPSLTGTGASGSWGISITGSAATLTTARTINGTSFNGSANITTASWGTARTITIGNTGKSVDGSGNVSWTLSEIGALAGGGYSANQNLNTSSGVTFGEIYNDGWFRNNVSGRGLYNQATGNHFYSEGGTWSVAYSGTQAIRFRNGYGGTTLGYLYAETNANFGLLHSGGGWSIQISPGGGSITLHHPVYGGQFISSDWFRNTGATGLYNNTYGRGIIEAQAGSATYGNMTTYGSGYNGWEGWSIGTSTYQVNFMARPSVADWGLHAPLRGWAFYQNHSAHGGVSIGGASPLSGYALRIEGNAYTNSGQYAYAFYGHSNVAGTGNAIYCPNGVYSTGTNWLYGTMHLNGNTINGIGSAYLNSSGSGGFYCTSQWAFYYDATVNRFGCWTSTTTAGYGFTFNTSVQFNGTITVAGSKNFAITHPIDDTKQLVYASIEGPRVDVLHRGAAIVTTHAILDLDEEAGLLPGTCARLMRDLQCQVTNVDDHFCQIRARIDGTQLHIYTDTPLPTRIAWIVLGERQDAEIRESHMTDNEGRLITERDRPETSEGAPLPAR